MSRVVDDAHLPEGPEIRAALVGYVEWGSRSAMQNCRSGAADVTERAPRPRGGWAEAPPYRP